MARKAGYCNHTISTLNLAWYATPVGAANDILRDHFTPGDVQGGKVMKTTVERKNNLCPTG